MRRKRNPIQTHKKIATLTPFARDDGFGTSSHKLHTAAQSIFRTLPAKLFIMTTTSKDACITFFTTSKISLRSLRLSERLMVLSPEKSVPIRVIRVIRVLFNYH